MRVFRFLGVLGFCLFWLCASCFGDEAAEIEKLKVELVALARPEGGVGKDAQEVSAKFKKLDHEKVVRAMLPLLKSDKEGVAYLASYVVLGCRDGLRVRDFDALKTGFENGGGWLPMAIASLGSEEAVDYLVKAFRADPETQGQVDWALVTLKAKAIPAILREFEDVNLKHEQRFLKGLRYVLKSMKGEGRSAIPRLIEMAESKDLDVGLRKEAVLLIGAVGLPAEAVFPRMRLLTKREPVVFRDVVDEAMVMSGAGSGAAVLADKVDEGASHYLIRDIAMMGGQARELGPRVVGWLKLPDWEARVMAAHAIGAIGYEEGRGDLEGLLQEKMDWRLAYTAARSLAELGSKESIPALKKAASTHWFPIVRTMAEDAVRSLEGKGAVREWGATEAGNVVDYVFVDRDHLSNDVDLLKGVGGPREGGALDERFSEFAKREPVMAEKFIEVRDTNGEQNLKGYGGMISLRAGDTLLLGARAGEWVGGLHAVSKLGDQRRLLARNVFGIAAWRGKVLVASGTYHMGMNEGIVNAFVEGKEGMKLQAWFVLPGEPNGMWVTKDDRLVVDCIGGTVVFEEPGVFAYVSGKRAPKDDRDEGDPFE